uniref:Uncharacterized protein n=1 Tax=Anguilla anguilla TaxID=7936 RepID=A0A0E9U6I5_ANGAN
MVPLVSAVHAGCREADDLIGKLLHFVLSAGFVCVDECFEFVAGFNKIRRT